MILGNVVPSEPVSAALAALRRMAGASGRLRATGLLERLALRLDVTKVEAAEALRELHRLELVTYAADVQGLPVSVFVSVAPNRTVKPQYEDWRDALTQSGFSGEQLAVLADLAGKLEEVPPDDLVRLATGLRALSEQPPQVFEEVGFNLSARHLLGSAKVLASLTPTMLGALGLPGHVHDYSPRYVVCAGPAQPSSILLIENPPAFETAIRSGLAARAGLICTFGFGLGYLRVSSIEGSRNPVIPLPRGGNPPALAKMLSHPRIHLAADLDHAGLDIYASLKSQLPNLQLSALYEVMADMALDRSRSHPYAALFEKDGQGRVRRELSTGAEPAVVLLRAACATRAVDQEALLPQHWLAYGGDPLSTARLEQRLEEKRR